MTYLREAFRRAVVRPTLDRDDRPVGAPVMTDRRRNGLVLLIVVGLLAASCFVIATKPTFLGLDLKGGVELVYQGKATAQSQVTSDSLNRAIAIMRKRVDQLGVAEPSIEQYGSNDIEVGLPNVTNEARATEQVGKTAQLQFYDWEPNVIGPDGQPAGAERARRDRRRRRRSGRRHVGRHPVPGGAARRRAPGHHPPQRHDVHEGLHGGHERDLGLPVRRLVPRQRHDPGGARRAGRSAVRAEESGDGARGARAQARDRQDARRPRQPGHRRGRGDADRERQRRRHGRQPELVLRPQRQPGAQRQRHHQPGAGHRPEQRSAERHVRLQLARQDGVRADHEGDRHARRARPGSGRVARRRPSSTSRSCSTTSSSRCRRSTTRSTRPGSTPPTARRSAVASRSTPPRTSPTSCSPAHCRSA